MFAVIGGDPEFKPEMKALTDALLGRTTLESGADPAARVHEIARTMVQRRVAAPLDDWISGLADSQVLGEPLSLEQMVEAVVSLITGGHHSTSRGLGSLLARLVTEPGLQEQLRAEPALIPAAVEETLRLHTPLPEFSRCAVTGTEVGGVRVGAGQHVQLRYDVANRDDVVFAEPAEFRLDRRHSQHLAFGFGPHRCVGIHLARAEMRLAVEKLCDRTVNLVLAREVRWRGPAEPEALWVRA